MEYEIEAEIVHSFLSQRATGESISGIIASGDRARLTSHYVSNSRMQDGELILMDFGAEYGGYCADLTRTRAGKWKIHPSSKKRCIMPVCTCMIMPKAS